MGEGLACLPSWWRSVNEFAGHEAFKTILVIHQVENYALSRKIELNIPGGSRNTRGCDF